MILHINNVLSHQTKTHSSPYLWWRSKGGELWLILLLTRSELFSHRCSLIRISLAKSRLAVPRLDLTFLLGASDLVCAWTCEISWLLIRDSLIYRHLTLCTGQGSISLISLTQTDTWHASLFCWYFPVSLARQGISLIKPVSSSYTAFNLYKWFRISLKYLIIFKESFPNNRSD